MPDISPPDIIPETIIVTDEIAAFEKYLHIALGDLREVEACVGVKIYNSVAKQGKEKPYLIYKVIPLDDNTGQGGLSIQTRIYCDIQIFAGYPHPESVDAASAAIKERFSRPRSDAYGGWSISVRRYRPISRTLSGATASDTVVVRGGTYKGWISKAP